MTRDGLLVLECLFGTIWQLFTGWVIPGTTVTPAEFICFLIFAGIILRWLSALVGIRFDGRDPLLDDLPIHNTPRTHSGAPELGTRAWEFYNDPGTRSHR